MGRFEPEYYTLCSKTYREIALYLLEAGRHHSAQSITAYLLEGIERGGISPPVGQIWLGISKTPTTLLSAVNTKSRALRSIAFKCLSLGLRGTEWRKYWDAFSGVKGFLSLLQQSSVEDVEHLIKMLGRYTISDSSNSEKQLEFTNLLKALLPQWFPESEFKTSDPRSLLNVYLCLLPACLPPFVIDFLERFHGRPDDGAGIRNDLMLSTAYRNFRQTILDKIGSIEELPLWIQFSLNPLLHNTPPLPSAHLNRLSAPIEFSLDVLSALIRHRNGTTLAPYQCLDDLIVPVLRRLRKRNVESQTVHSILDRIYAYASQNPSIVTSDSFSGELASSFLTCVMRHWSKRPDAFLDLLTTTLELIRQHRGIEIHKSGSYLCIVPSRSRYLLLRLIGQHGCKIRIDIEDTLSLRKVPTEIIWQRRIFNLLEEKEALRLVDALIACPQGGTLTLRKVFSATLAGLHRTQREDADGHQPKHSVDKGDLKSLRLELAQGKDEQKSLNELKTLIEESKRSAVRSRDQSDRANNAEQAFVHSIASGNIGLYADTLEWSRRYLKDPLTTMSLFSARLVCKPGVVDMLSALKALTKTVDVEHIHSEVLEGNKVLLKFLDLASVAMREPSYQARHWSAVIQLIGLVVKERIWQAKTFQTHFKLSDGEVYDSVFKGTLSTLIEAEELVLVPDNEGLQLSRSEGLLTHIVVQNDHLIPSTAQFLDNLAKERDRLWMQQRASDFPQTTVLPPPWPRGLPIQTLIPVSDWKMPRTTISFPYLEGRARDIVLMQSSLACSEIPEGENLEAIDGFVDSLQYALRLFVYLPPSEIESRERVFSAWQHALSNFSDHFPTKFEIIHRWRLFFSSALGKTFEEHDCVQKDPVKEADDYPIHIPEDAFVTDAAGNEWNPAVQRPKAIESIRYKRVAIDCCAYTSTRQLLRVYLTGKEMTSYSYKPWGVWVFERLSPASRQSGKIQDGLIASALLYLDVSTKGNGRILSQSFPEQCSSVRFPSMFLDVEFLSRIKECGGHTSHAFEILRKYLDRVPPGMLSHLAQGMLDALKSMSEKEQRATSIECDFYGVLGLLIGSDRPEIASKLVSRAILDRPDSSSWHRQILNRGLLKKLPSSEVTHFMENFTRRVIELASAGRANPIQPSQKSPTPKKGPYVKITTVKMLVQLLTKGDVVPVPTAIATLKKLLLAKSHIDVRVAALDAAINLIAETPNNELSGRILEDVQSFLGSLVPVLGSLSERDGPIDDLFTTRFDGKELPALDEDTPLYDLVYNASRNVQLPEVLREHIERVVLLPALDESVRNHRRWIELYLHRDYPSLNVANYPIPPKKWEMLSNSILSCPEWLPVAYLDLHCKYEIARDYPTKEIKGLLHQGRKDIHLRGTASLQHILRVFGSGWAPRVYPTLLERDWDWPLSKGGITIQAVEECVLQNAKMALEVDELCLASWQNLFKQYELPRFNQHVYHWGDKTRIWKIRFRPLVVRFIKIIESYRANEAWQRDPARHPRRLPRLYPLRLMLLSYPYLKMNESEDCEEFAEEICAIIDRLAKSRQPYHQELLDLKEAVTSCSPPQITRVALRVGKTSLKTKKEGQLPLETLLRVELADGLLRNTKPDDKALASCKSLLKGWLDCQCEQVRDKAIALYIDKKWLDTKDLL